MRTGVGRLTAALVMSMIGAFAVTSCSKPRKEGRSRTGEVTMLTALVIGLGLIHGYLNGAGLGPPSVGVQILLGLAGVLFVLVSVVGAFVVQLRQLWARTVVRVLGSWIVASGLLMLGWAVHSARAT